MLPRLRSDGRTNARSNHSHSVESLRLPRSGCQHAGNRKPVSYTHLDVYKRQSLQDEANEWRYNLLETAVGMDDEAMEAYLEGNEPSAEKLRELIRKGTLDIAFIPVSYTHLDVYKRQDVGCLYAD